MFLVKTRIGPSKIHGIGVFAEERIPKGQMIWVFDARIDVRSEEHTSELQSRLHLVCRLLLEKKKERMRKGESSPSCIASRSIPPMLTVPRVGCYRPVISCGLVLLPGPVVPGSTRKYPVITC